MKEYEVCLQLDSGDTVYVVYANNEEEAEQAAYDEAMEMLKHYKVGYINAR